MATREIPGTGATITLPDDATDEQWAQALSGYSSGEAPPQPPDWDSFGPMIFAAPVFDKIVTTSATNAFTVLTTQVTTYHDERNLLAMFAACRAGLSGDNVLDQADIDSINAILSTCNFTIRVSL